MSRLNRAILTALLGISLAACTGDDGRSGPAGVNGDNGADGADGANGADGADGVAGDPGLTPLAFDAPLSSMVALSFQSNNGINDPATDLPATDIAGYVKGLVARYDADTLPAGLQFPLKAAATDSLRAIKGLHANVVASWLDPLTYSADAVNGPIFGANTDYIAYFGDDWDSDGNMSPMFEGDDTAGHVWVNHEYISNNAPTATSAPSGHAQIFARYMRFFGGLDNVIESDIWDEAALTKYIQLSKTQVGGSWIRILQDPGTGEWQVDFGADNQRYDATSDTLLKLTGAPGGVTFQDHDDAGNNLPTDVVVGIMGDCSGGQTPWGTVITAEENVQFYYGDLEDSWSGDQLFVTGGTFDPGAPISFSNDASPTSDYGRSPDTNTHHSREFYGYLAEMDPVEAGPGVYYDSDAKRPGVGHKKLGAAGRARWENATFHTDTNWDLIPDRPITLYSGNDRRSGRVYKFVTSANYEAGMTKKQIRDLLDDGRLFVGHFQNLDVTTGNRVVTDPTTDPPTTVVPTSAAPGSGTWIELSVSNTDQNAPNAGANANLPADTRVGAALLDDNWNGIGGFSDDYYVRWALFTAAAKLGVAELNRPEDLEYNPFDGLVYIAFTNHTRRTALDQNGVLLDATAHALTEARADTLGAIFAIREGNPSDPYDTSFEYFEVWHGATGDGEFTAANPDNILIDAVGDVWFGTDGNFSATTRDETTTTQSDGFYYLDQTDPTVARAFRVAAMPSDAESTGPAFTSRMGTLFLSVQHPGEFGRSSWPQTR